MKPNLLVLCLAGLAACDSSMTRTSLSAAATPAVSASPSSAPAPQALAPVLDPNEVLAARVKRELEAQDKKLAGGIDVTASDGAITLWGTTDTDAQRKRAEGVVAKTEGVKSVNNRITVVKGS
jgi:hypothetical protein